MSKNLDGLAAPERGAWMREQLAAFAARAAEGALALRLPAGSGARVPRGDGHFHLAPELFLQVGGSTLFRFPDAQLRVGPGEAAVLPPRLLHAEAVKPGPREPFCNVVVYAEGPTVSCHLAHEARPGYPGILHLEARRHGQAPRIHDWLADAARLGADGGPWAAEQARALLIAALAGVLRALDDAHAQAPEPPLVARTRVMVQNQLGDHRLSVRGLAEQLGCTADYLSHLFSQTTGEHLAAYVNRQRMERAAHLLRDTAMAGKEVAWACGFATQSYFIRTFRGHHGVTPKAFRLGAEP